MFFCDEIYMPGYTCRRPQALLIESTPPVEDSDQPSQEEVPIVTCEEVPPIENTEEPLIQLSVLSEDRRSETMQLKGSYNDNMVHVLIYLGATHNFIHPTLVKLAKAKPDAKEALPVRVARGAILKTRGKVTTEI